MVHSFSVIIAVYNAQAYLRETLDSIRRQTYPHFEVVMVDDGSTDDSAAIARQFCVSDPRFRLLSTPNRGISPTRNLAISHARADWLAICDADDTWAPDKLERQARFIAAWDEREHGPLAALGTSARIINGDGQVFRVDNMGIHTYEEYRRWRDEIGQMAMINSSVVFRRDFFERVGGYHADYTPAEDTDLWTRLADLGVVLNLPEPLTGYRMHGGNISETSYVRMMLNALRIRANSKRRAAGRPELEYDEFRAELEREGRLEDVLRELRHGMHYYLARNRWHNGRRLGGLASFLRATLVDPRRSAALVREGVRHRVRRLGAA